MKSDRPVVAIIFSKDRAMQLDACLRSFALHCRDHQTGRLRVLYTCSSKRSDAQYADLRRTYQSVEFIREGSFREDLCRALEGSTYVLFLVDDSVFIRGWSFQEVIEAFERQQQTIGFSLRLGRNTTYCYARDSAQRLPEFLEVAPNIMRFSWATGEYDFGYPLEVSSSLYRSDLLLPFIGSASSITDPNSLEEVLDGQKDAFLESHGHLLCFSTSVAFSNPANIVQTDRPNRSRNDFASSPNALMWKFDLGYRIELAPLTNLITNACHQDVEYAWITPPMEATHLTAAVEVQGDFLERGGLDHAGTETLSAHCSLSTSEIKDDEKERVLAIIKELKASAGSDSNAWLLDLLRRFDEFRREELEVASRSIDVLRGKLVDLERLKHTWYEPELARLTQLVADGEQLKETWYEPELAWLRGQLQENVKELEYIKGLGIWRAYERYTRLRSKGVTFKSLLRRGDYRAVLRSVRNMLGLSFLKLPEGLNLTTSNPLTSEPSFVSKLVPQGAVPDLHQLSSVLSEKVGASNAKVSVIIPCFNYGSYIREAVDSVLQQTVKNLEVIVVNDGSTDAQTLNVLSSLENDRVKVLHQTNQGLSTARNNGVGVATGDYVLFLDADDRLDRNAIALLLYHLSLHPEAAYAYSYQRFFGDENLVWACQEFNAYDLLWSNHPSVSPLLRRDVLAKSKGFRPEMKYGYEDWESWVGLAAQNQFGQCVCAPVFEHRRHGTTMTHRAHEKKRLLFETILRLNSNSYRPETISTTKRKWRPAVSVIIPFFNGHRFIRETINSLMGQSFKDFEVILVNDGSDDPASINLLDEIREEGFVKVVDCEHRGLSATRNIGALTAQADLIVFLDADDLVDKTALEKFVLAALFHPTYAFVYSGIVHFGEINGICLDPFDHKRLLRENYLAFTCVMQRSVYLTVGGMDENYTDGYEDYDYWLRLISQGYQGKLLPELLFMYRRHSGGNRTRLKEEHGDLRMLREVRRRHPKLFGGPAPDVSKWKLIDYDPLRNKDALARDIDAAYAKQLTGHVPYNGYRRPNLPNPFPAEHWKSKKIHILYLVPFFAFGGAERVDLNIIKGLPKEQFHVTVVACQQAEHAWYDEFAKWADEIFILSSLDLDPDKQHQFLSYLMMSRSVDIVFNRNSSVGYHFIAKWRMVSPHLRFVDLLHLHVFGEDFVRYSSPFHNNYHRRYLITHDLQDYAVKKYGLDGERFKVIHCGADPEEFSISRKVYGELRQQLGVAHDTRIVGFVGRLTDQKNPLLWLDVVDLVGHRHTDIHFVLVGDGELLGQCKRKAEKLAIRDRVHLVGYKRDVHEYMAGFDLLLLTSRYEGAPLAVFEALMSGVPVVSSDVGGVAECLMSEIGAIVNAQAPAAEYAAKVIEMLKRATNDKDLSLRCREYALQRFTIDRMQNEYRKDFTELAAKLDRQARLRDYQIHLMNAPLIR